MKRLPDPDDRRAVGLQLTAKGRDLAKRVVKISEDFYREAFSCLTADERKRLETILKKLRAYGLKLPETDHRLRRAGYYDLWKA